MKELLISVSPILLLLALWVGGVYLVKYIVSRFLNLK